MSSLVIGSLHGPFPRSWPGSWRVPELRVRSTIAFESCIIDSGELDGTLSYDWDLSSPASRSATQWTTAYGFSDMRFTQRDESEATIEQADGDFAGQIRLAPTVVYGNNTEVGVLFHTAGGWDSGEISLTSTEGSSLLIQPGSSIESLLFQLTDSDGNETLIEREWFVSASCRGEEEFQLSLCLPI